MSIFIFCLLIHLNNLLNILTRVLKVLYQGNYKLNICVGAKHIAGMYQNTIQYTQDKI
jgi:hypothetical protein